MLYPSTKAVENALEKVGSRGVLKVAAKRLYAKADETQEGDPRYSTHCRLFAEQLDTMVAQMVVFKY